MTRPAGASAADPFEASRIEPVVLGPEVLAAPGPMALTGRDAGGEHPRVRDSATVLLVAPGRLDRERIGRWLEGAGYRVLLCPGPPEDHDCVGLRGRRCPLAWAADVVVLDMGPGDWRGGPVLPGWRLLDLYSGWEIPLVAIVPWGVLISEDPIVPVERPPSREELLGAVGRSLSGRFVRSATGNDE